MKCPPEPVIDSAILHAKVEFLLGSALEGLPLFQCRMAIAGNGVQHLRPVGEEKSVADIEEDDAPLCHDSILPNARERRVSDCPPAAPRSSLRGRPWRNCINSTN